MEFAAVRCPACIAAPVVLEIATGISRGKCPACKRRVWALCNGTEVRIGMVDAPARTLKPLPAFGA